MYTKISHGTNFMGAALYDAEGLSKEQKKAKVGKTELLQTNNLLSQDARGIALEMQKVASYSRSEKPVWNIAMSAPVGVELSADQWRTAAAQNLMALGVELDRYQFAIYRHRDTRQDHVHILLNAVPVDGRPALSRQFKAVAAKKAATKIDQAVGIVAVKGVGIREELARILTLALEQYPTTPDELKADLLQLGITTGYKHNAKGIYGVTFQLTNKDHEPIKGSDVLLPDGHKAKWSVLSAILEGNRAAYQAEIERLRQEKAEIERDRDIAVNRPPVIVEKVVTNYQDKAELEELYERLTEYEVAIHNERGATEELTEALTRLQKENARLQHLNQTPRVEIRKEIVKEFVEVPDPADKAEIDRLRGQLASKDEVHKKVVNKVISVYISQLKELERENEELKRKLEAKTEATSARVSPVSNAMPSWHEPLRQLLKDKRKTASLGMGGFAYEKSQNDLLIWPTKGSKEDAVKLSEFAPECGMLRELRRGQRL